MRRRSSPRFAHLEPCIDPVPLVLACDVGGTLIKVAIVRGSELLARGAIEAQPRKGFASAMRRIFRLASSLCRSNGIPRRELGGLALSFPGIIEPRTERILSTPAGKFDDAKDFDVHSTVFEELGIRALVCNDANAAMAGEWKYGAARKCRSAVMMTLGTGIGTSAIIEGVPLRGEHGQAGCLGGHMTANLSGGICPCGNLGCAETEASTWALPAQAKGHPGYASSALAGSKLIDYAAVFAAAADGDSVARDLKDHAFKVWAATLVSLIHAYDPECAVIGGGIMRSGRVILPALRRHVIKHAWTPWGTVKIRSAALGNDAGILGAAWLLQQSLG